MPDVDDFMLLTVLELMRRSAKFVIQREGANWKLTATWKDGQLDDKADSEEVTSASPAKPIAALRRI